MRLNRRGNKIAEWGRPARLLPGLALGLLILGVAVELLPAQSHPALAAPLPQPEAAISTAPLIITHTAATTHQMSVFANGRISSQFLSKPGRNHIDVEGQDPYNTTIAVMFDQHPGNQVDVGAQGEFTPTMPITLRTGPDAVPGYSEDTSVVYGSGVLSYQVTQRTLATTTNNCVVMELDIANIGAVSLTGGKLLYMIDIDVGFSEVGDEGIYDPDRRLIYQKDWNPSGSAYAMGISLLEGNLSGYGSLPDTALQFPNPLLDSRLRSEMTTPTNAVAADTNDIYNLVSWLVVDIPTLLPGQSSPIAFGLCANYANGSQEADALQQAVDDMMKSFSEQANLSALKSAIPAAGSTVAAGQPVTYQVALANTGSRPIDHIILTDTVPAGSDLLSYNTTQGTITAGDGLITATIGRLEPTNAPVTVTLVVRPWLTLTSGTTISNQAFVQSEPIITQTNLVTHSIINAPPLVQVDKTGPATARVGDSLTFTYTVTNKGQTLLQVIRVEDDYAGPATLVSGDDNSDGWLGLAESWIYTASYTVPPDAPLTQTNTVTVTAVDAAGVETVATATHTTTVTGFAPVLFLDKKGPVSATIHQRVTYAFYVINVTPAAIARFNLEGLSAAAFGDGSPIKITMVTDDVTGEARYTGGDLNQNGLLDGGEGWVYTTTYTIAETDPLRLVNQAIVTGTDREGDTLTASDTHMTIIQARPDPASTFYFPFIFKNSKGN